MGSKESQSKGSADPTEFDKSLGDEAESKPHPLLGAPGIANVDQPPRQRASTRQIDGEEEIHVDQERVEITHSKCVTTTLRHDLETIADDKGRRSGFIKCLDEWIIDRKVDVEKSPKGSA